MSKLVRIASLALFVFSGCGGAGAPPATAPSGASSGGSTPSDTTASSDGVQVTIADGAEATKLPEDVRALLIAYVSTLRSCTTLEQCAEQLTPLCGGGLVNEDGSLRDTVPPYSMKKDWEAVRLYAVPLEITRVDTRDGDSSGFGATAISGMSYKVWIAKAPGQPGMPAPVTMLAPAAHPTVKGPRLVNIGSF